MKPPTTPTANTENHTTAEAHTHEGHAHPTSWLELFYDLLFVTLVSQLAHGLLEKPGLATTAQVFSFFVPVWWAWASYTLILNVYREGGEKPFGRILVLANMACLLVMAGGIGEALHGSPALFAIGYAAGRLLIAVPWMIMHWNLHGPRLSVAAWSPLIISAALFLASTFSSPPTVYLYWAVGLLLEIVMPIFITTPIALERGSTPALDVSHLVERFGLFVIIVLGEGVVQIVAALAGSHGSFAAVTTGVAGFGALATIWWVYFALGPVIRKVILRAEPMRAFALEREVFVFGHFFIVAGIMAAGVGLGAMVTAASTSEPFSVGLKLVCGALALYEVTKAVIVVRYLGQRFVVALAWLLPILGVLALLFMFGHGLHPTGALLIVFAGLTVGALIGVKGHKRMTSDE